MKKVYCTVQAGRFSFSKIKKGRCSELGCDYNTKPENGIWASLYKENGYSSWYNLIKNLEDEKKYSITTFELNENARVLEIVSEKDVLEFEEKYFQEKRVRHLVLNGRIHKIIDTEFINWDSVFMKYDAIYVSQEVANYKCFYNWIVDTLYISNKNAINKDSIVKLKR